MRVLIVCLTAVMILGGGLSMGRHYFASQEHERAVQVTDLAPNSGLTNQYLADAGYQPLRLSDIRLTQKQEESKAVAVINGSALKAVVQPSLPPASVVVQTPSAKLEKKMIGPDGVAFVRTATLLTKTLVVKASRPIAPESLGLEQQAKASATQTVVELLPAPAVEPKPQPTVVAAATPEISKITPAKTAGLMVGPDGVVYQHVRAVTPR